LLITIKNLHQMCILESKNKLAKQKI
jgi:hypothetical protein